MREIAYKDIPEEDVHHPQITSPNERRIYNLRLIKPRKHPVVVRYAHAQIVHYVMTQYSLSKGLKKFKKVGDVEVEKELNQLHTKSTFAPMNVAKMSNKEK